MTRRSNHQRTKIVEAIQAAHGDPELQIAMLPAYKMVEEADWRAATNLDCILERKLDVLEAETIARMRGEIKDVEEPLRRTRKYNI